MRLIPLLVGLLAFGIVAPAAATRGQVRVVDPCEPGARMDRLLVELVVNEVPTGLVTVLLQRPCGAVLARIVDLRRVRLRPEGQPTITVNGFAFVNLSDFPGVSVRIDRARSLAFIEADPSLFEPTVIDFAQVPVRPLTPPATGAFVNYGAFVTGRPDLDPLLSGTLTLGLFGSPGVLLSDWILAEGVGDTALRLNTVFVRDFPERIAGLRVGDVQARAAPWGGGHALGGVQWATNFATRPGMVISRGAEIEALTARSAVLFLESERVGDPDARRSPVFYGGLGTVPHGPVEIVNLPVYHNGRYYLRVRDALGREQAIQRDFYFSQGLLRPGLHDYSYSLGLRRPSFLGDRYEEPFATLDHRYGLRRYLTAGIHADLAEGGDHAVGGTLQLAVPWVGVLGLSAAVSHGAAFGSGDYLGATLENRYGGLAYAAVHERRSADFAPPAQGPSTVAHRSAVTIGTRLPWRDSLNLGFSEIADRVAGYRADLRAGYVFGLPRGALLSLSLARALTPDDDWAASLTFSMPLARLPGTAGRLDALRPQFTLTASQASGADAQAFARVGLRTAAGDTPLGISVGSELLGQRRDAINATAIGERYTALAGVTVTDGGQTWTLGASSGLIWIGDRLLPTRPLNASFALVRLGEDFAGVRVNGRRADRHGDVLVEPLQPYYDTRIEVATRDLPHTVRLPETVPVVNPHFRSGAVVDYPLRRVRDALVQIVLRDAEGRAVPLPQGAEVRIDGAAQRLPVGRNGRVYVPEMGPRATMVVRWRGRSCTIALALPPDDAAADTIPTIGPLDCPGVTP